MRIQIYGSTYLTQVCVAALQADGHDLIGYVPNANEPTVPGKIDLPVLEWLEWCDLLLSIQYDKRIAVHTPAFNLHTGLLPNWGGCDILYHTLREGAVEQGLTFHRIVDGFDRGPILTKITYPVFLDDTMVDLYRRMVGIAPEFVCQAVRLVELIGMDQTHYCHAEVPRVFKRGAISKWDRETYDKTPALLRAMFTKEGNK